ncbi:unnamed protein product [Euphydryas editha]|uniref:Lipocalin/cytosolic fatty-acid binding domain-containing protein n=1 Tax=Euphydryas editha TaxID=104508 RepID=A0AAU9V9J3_EUPED|nr:unnamed protein product [Euphydryas editha]
MKFVFTFRTGLFTQLSHREVVNGQFSMRNGTLLPIPPQYSAIYEDGVSYDFVVLKTNYNDYAILYSCQNTANGKSVMAWKLSRTPTPSYTSLTNFDTVVKNNTDLVNATWFTPSHSKEACTIRNNAINLQNTANGKSGCEERCGPVPLAALGVISIVIRGFGSTSHSVGKMHGYADPV